MKIEIQTPHFKASKSLTDLVKEKVKTLSIISDDIVRADVTLTIDHTGKTMHQHCNILLNVRGKDVFAKAKADSFEKAIADCVDAVKRKMRKRKTKILARRIKKELKFSEI